MDVVVPAMPECTEPCGACGDERAVYVIDILVRPDEMVQPGQLVAVVETEKTTVEIDSPAVGRVATVAARAGQRVREGTVLLTLADD